MPDAVNHLSWTVAATLGGNEVHEMHQFNFYNITKVYTEQRCSFYKKMRAKQKIKKVRFLLKKSIFLNKICTAILFFQSDAVRCAIEKDMLKYYDEIDT